MSRALRTVCFAVVAAVLLAPGARPAGAQGEGKLVVAWHVHSLDPSRIESEGDERLVLACFEPLTVFDPATGAVSPGAAESWQASPDGRTWTFVLREATWRKRDGEGFKEVAKVTAEDFVYAWLRLIDPGTASPHAQLLDALPGVSVLSTDRPRAAALDRIVADLDDAIGGKANRTLSGEVFLAFLGEPDRGARRWLGELNAPEAREALAWKEKDGYPAPKARKLMGVLSAERDRLLKLVAEAEQHVGKDRAFWAKDARTLVVQAAGASPWVPSLVSRGPLAPVHPNTVDRRRDKAFTASQNFVANGAFVSATEFPLSETDDSGEPTQFKVVLVKNPHFHGAGKVPSSRIECLVNEKPDEVLRRYGLGELAWIGAGGVTAEALKAVRAAKAPDAKTDTGFARDCKAAAADLYDAASGAVYLLRFRCAPPLDQPGPRRALAALVDREVLAKAQGSGATLPPLRRIVHPRTAGVAEVAVPAWDPGKAKAMYGPRKFEDSVSWITLLAASDDDKVADALAAAWRKGGIPDDVSVTVKAPGKDLRDAVDGGQWEAALWRWSPGFDDPLAFLTAFTTGHPAGDHRWSNPVYDALVAGATDPAAFAASPAAGAKDLAPVKAALPGAKDPKGLEALRRVLLAEAERILLDEAVVVPLWMPVTTGVLSRKVRGVQMGGPNARALLDVVSVLEASVAE